MADSAKDRALFQQWITSPAAGYCRQNPDGSRYDWAAEERKQVGFTLTDEERRVIESAIEDMLYGEWRDDPDAAADAATLRNLLERTK